MLPESRSTEVRMNTLLSALRLQRTWVLAALVATVLVFPAATSWALKPGDKAPTFSAPALDGGKNLALSAYRGKVIYLDFWASWCGPCLTSLPLLEELRSEFPSEDFQVLAVNVDDDPDKARKFLSRISVNYPSATDPAGRIPEIFGVETMPTSFIIDRNGVVRHVQNGFHKSELDSLRSRIQELVGAGK
jgi:peroxiredoxin